MAQVGRFEEEKAIRSLLAMPENIVHVPQYNRPELAIFCPKSPSIGVVNGYHSPDLSRIAVGQIIAYYAAQLNIGKQLQPFQIEFIAQEICTQYYYLNLSEVKYVMYQGIKGVYGKNYDRMDIQVVSEWFARYDESRTRIAQRERQTKNESVTPSNTAVPAPDYVVERLKQLDARFSQRRGVNACEMAKDAAYQRYLLQEMERRRAVEDEF